MTTPAEHNAATFAALFAEDGEAARTITINGQPFAVVDGGDGSSDGSLTGQAMDAWQLVLLSAAGFLPRIGEEISVDGEYWTVNARRRLGALLELDLLRVRA